MTCISQASVVEMLLPPLRGEEEFTHYLPYLKG